MTKGRAVQSRGPEGRPLNFSPAREGWDIDSATSSERRRRGNPNVGSAAPPVLHNLGDPSTSPSPDFLWNLVALANLMRLSLLKGARAASSSAAWQEIRVPGWADVLSTGPPGLSSMAIFAVSILSQLATGKPTARDDKGGGQLTLAAVTQ